MKRRRRLLPGILVLSCLATGASALAQSALFTRDMEDARKALAQASKDGDAAGRRAQELEKTARLATEKADKAAHESAALAARIQQSQAEIASEQAQIKVLEAQSRELEASLAERQRPLIGLTAALQRLSRRPPILALLRPGSVKETMHLRALLETMIPEVERRTADLRTEIAQLRGLERRAEVATDRLRTSQAELRKKRAQLVQTEMRARLQSREASGVASREAERALAMAEKARDLTGLMQEIGKQGQLREQLARLPGPIMRPVSPQDSEVRLPVERELAQSALGAYVLPVPGRILTGFGDVIEGKPRSRGIMLAVRPGAQAVAPAAGRVAFAGEYKGYGHIVIVEHEGGWTSLVTGLAQLDTQVGANLVAGAPIGIAGSSDPVVNVELRQDGKPVNPLKYVE